MSEHQAIRDLRWALTSPPLLDHKLAVDEGWGERELAQNQGLIGRLSAPKSPLFTALKRRSTSRLGEYFETLVRVWIDEVPPANLIGSNIQVHGKGGTVGEFDLLFERDGDLHHWELAVKFYLGYPGDHAHGIWLGPNPEDVWLEKWRRMRKHQLRLSRMREGRRKLRRLGLRKQARSRAFVKGWLFDSLDPQYAVEAPPDTNGAAARGWWVHRSSVEEFVPIPGPPQAEGWRRLRHDEWMSPAVQDEDRAPFSSLSAALAGTHPDRAQLVSGLRRGDDGWREVTRGFVVPDEWPRR